jgi:predicted secreted protein
MTTPQPITAAVGEEFEVRLSAAPSAGYRWEVQTLPPEIRLEGTILEAPTGRPQPGDSANEVFHFRSHKAGEYTITLVYKRSWESTAAASHTVNVTVR